uniref:Uncharacterized protein n=1 Tax=Siphoviridae sp. ctXbO14 TaxID=2827579 RepID=A0A8S5LK60_9CAUD|nr:MAG TPA: hypothetical protein [Siphoviridae sp. ctXbO14]
MHYLFHLTSKLCTHTTYIINYTFSYHFDIAK